MAFEQKYSSMGRKQVHCRKKLRDPTDDAFDTRATLPEEGLGAWDLCALDLIEEGFDLKSFLRVLECRGLFRDPCLDPWKLLKPLGLGSPELEGFRPRTGLDVLN